ncbi:hypothetical protein SAFG77S_08127 [Streptomyces afghaniensis]
MAEAVDDLDLGAVDGLLGVGDGHLERDGLAEFGQGAVAGDVDPHLGLGVADHDPDAGVAGVALGVLRGEGGAVGADWLVEVGPGAGEHGGRVLHSGPVAGLAAVDGDGSPVRPLPRPGARGPRTERVAEDRAGHPAQPARCGRRVPARRVHRGHRGVRLRQVDAHRGAHTGHARRRQAGLGGSEADRTHAAFEPRDVHRPFRRRTQGVRGHRRGTRARLRCRPVLLQRGGRALRDLPGRGVRQRGVAVPAEHVRALPGTAAGLGTTRRRWRWRTGGGTSRRCWI